MHSIAASHFDGSCELVGRIREAETSQMNPIMSFDRLGGLLEKPTTTETSTAISICSSSVAI